MDDDAARRADLAARYAALRGSPSPADAAERQRIVDELRRAGASDAELLALENVQ